MIYSPESIVSEIALRKKWGPSEACQKVLFILCNTIAVCLFCLFFLLAAYQEDADKQ